MTPECALDHGFLEADNNSAERSMRCVALGRKNYLFMGSERGGQSAAIAYTLIETAKLNAVNPQAWLTDVLSRIADHKSEPRVGTKVTIRLPAIGMTEKAPSGDIAAK